MDSRPLNGQISGGADDTKATDEVKTALPNQAQEDPDPTQVSHSKGPHLVAEDGVSLPTQVPSFSGSATQTGHVEVGHQKALFETVTSEPKEGDLMRSDEELTNPQAGVSAADQAIGIAATVEEMRDEVSAPQEGRATPPEVTAVAEQPEIKTWSIDSKPDRTEPASSREQAASGVGPPLIAGGQLPVSEEGSQESQTKEENKLLINEAQYQPQSVPDWLKDEVEPEETQKVGLWSRAGGFLSSVRPPRLRGVVEPAAGGLKALQQRITEMINVSDDEEEDEGHVASHKSTSQESLMEGIPLTAPSILTGSEHESQQLNVISRVHAQLNDTEELLEKERAARMRLEVQIKKLEKDRNQQVEARQKLEKSLDRAIENAKDEIKRQLQQELEEALRESDSRLRDLKARLDEKTGRLVLAESELERKSREVDDLRHGFDQLKKDSLTQGESGRVLQSEIDGLILTLEKERQEHLKESAHLKAQINALSRSSDDELQRLKRQALEKESQFQILSQEANVLKSKFRIVQAAARTLKPEGAFQDQQMETAEDLIGVIKRLHTRVIESENREGNLRLSLTETQNHLALAEANLNSVSARLHAVENSTYPNMQPSGNQMMPAGSSADVSSYEAQIAALEERISSKNERIESLVCELAKMRATAEPFYDDGRRSRIALKCGQLIRFCGGQEIARKTEQQLDHVVRKITSHRISRLMDKNVKSLCARATVSKEATFLASLYILSLHCFFIYHLVV